MIPRLPTRSQIVLRDPPGVAALPKRPSGRSRLPRSDPSTVSSPATTPRTQIRPGVRGAIRSTDIPHNHSPPTLTNAPIQIRGKIANARSWAPDWFAMPAATDLRIWCVRTLAPLAQQRADVGHRPQVLQL